MKPRILVIGAHPDDCEYKAAGMTVLWRAAGHEVKYISMTDGSSGHHALSPEEIRERRRRETGAVAAILDVEYEILANRDGHLEADLERRLDLIGRIRSYRPDLILTHRPVDYHPDHRYTSILVQDSAFMMTVPLVCPGVPHLESNPVIAYLEDSFTRPTPFRADVVVDVDAVMPRKWEALRAHESQFFEWLPYNQGVLDRVPPGDDPAARGRWFQEWVEPWLLPVAGRYRESLVKRYGPERGVSVRFAEAFEISEYGSRPDAGELERLFPG